MTATVVCVALLYLCVLFLGWCVYAMETLVNGRWYVRRRDWVTHYSIIAGLPLAIVAGFCLALGWTLLMRPIA